jgi:GNAT superfamily N-acetyltransferase
VELPIEGARVRDAEQLLKLQYLCYQDEAARYEDWALPPLTQSLAALLAEYDTHRILAIRRGEEVIATVRGHEELTTCHIGRLCVHPRFQGQGLGTRLMAAIEAAFPTVDRYALFTGARSEGNLRLYRRLGYTEVRREMVAPGVELVHLEKWPVRA